MNKIEKLLLFILDRAHKGGIKDLSDFQVFKIFYNLQIYSIRYTGSELVPNVNFIREKNGPISIDVYHSLEKLRANHYIETKVIENKAYIYPRHANRLGKKSIKFDFTLGETIFLDNFLSDLLLFSQKALKELTYNTEPMKEIVKKEKGKIKKGEILDLKKVLIDQDVMEAYSNS